MQFKRRPDDEARNLLRDICNFWSSSRVSCRDSNLLRLRRTQHIIHIEDRHIHHVEKKVCMGSLSYSTIDQICPQSSQDRSLRSWSIRLENIFKVSLLFKFAHVSRNDEIFSEWLLLGSSKVKWNSREEKRRHFAKSSCQRRVVQSRVGIMKTFMKHEAGFYSITHISWHLSLMLRAVCKAAEYRVLISVLCCWYTFDR